jgi:hypothetical protein
MIRQGDANPLRTVPFLMAFWIKMILHLLSYERKILFNFNFNMGTITWSDWIKMRSAHEVTVRGFGDFKFQ